MRAPLTDLEGSVLGHIRHLAPITPYAVAKAVANSPSAFWSGSAGAVYPLIKRLTAQGLLAATEGQDGKRARTDYTLTPAGEAAFKQWLLDPHRAADLGYDPLRTRMLHLGTCEASEREAFMQEVKALISAAARQAREEATAPHLRLHATVTRARLELFKAFEKLLWAESKLDDTERG
jgi:DNA-binding PadR family transcriptional regulator